MGMPAEQCEALFRQHQTFLGLPHAPALGTAFLAMVQDHHNNLRKELEAEAAREAAHAAAAGHTRQGPGAEAGASAGMPGQHHEYAAEGARSAAGQEEQLADGAKREQAAKGVAGADGEADDDEGISFAVVRAHEQYDFVGCSLRGIWRRAVASLCSKLLSRAPA